MDSRLFPELFADSAGRFRDAVALSTDAGDWRYGELETTANRLAHLLRRRGVGPERLVALVMPRGAPLVLCELAVLKAGAAFLPIDPDDSADRIAAMLNDARPCCVLAAADTGPAVPSGSAPWLRFDAELQQRLASEPADLALPTDLRADHAACVIYTSGFTGPPKGVVTTHLGLAHLAAMLPARLDLREDARVAQIASPGTHASVTEMLAAFGGGATLVPLAGGLLAGEPLTRQLAERDITHALMPPATLATLPTGGCPRVRVLAVGGEACARDLAARWGADHCMINTYGLAEGGACVTTSSDLHADIGSPIGFALPDVQLLTLDAQLRQVPPGVTCELYVAGAGLARGYLNQPAATAAHFVANPYGPPGSRMFRTGDLVRRRRNRQLEFVGRVDSASIPGGGRIEFGLIEAALAAQDGIAQAAVVLREDTPGKARLVGYAVLRRGARIDTASWRSALARQLPEHLVPACIVVLSAMPLTSRGKLDHVALPRPPEDAADLVGRPLRSATEVRLGELFAEVLNLPAVDDAHADFFALGGHPLLATELGRRIRDELAPGFAPAGVHATPVLHELAALLDSGQPQERERPDLARESILPDHLAAAWKPNASPRTSDDLGRVFLTGGTGYVGAHLLGCLLRDTQASIVCHVRAGDPAAARLRLRDALKAQALDGAWRDDRVDVVAGELSRPDLGLDARSVRMVRETCDSLLHCGAEVEFLHPYERLKASNVDSVLTLLRWSAEGRRQRMHHVSTLGVVAPIDRPGPIAEDVPLTNWRGLTGGYNQSKWVADTLLQQALAAGAPVAIYRLGIITGDRTHALCNPNDALWRVTRLCAELRAVPDMDLRVNTTPVDDVAAAIVRLAANPASMGQTFHLLSGEMLTLHDIAGALEQAQGERVRRLDTPGWIALAREHVQALRDDDLTVLMGVLSKYADAAPQARAGAEATPQTRICGEATQRQLQRLGRPIRPVDSALLLRYLHNLGLHARKAVTS